MSTMRSAALAAAPVPSELLVGAVRAHADQVHDFVLRQGASPGASPGIVEASALAVVAAAADRPGELSELLGRWFAAAADRAGGTVGSGGEPVPDQDLLAAGLARRDRSARTALLLSDAYGLPGAAVAAGVGLGPDGALRLVGQARLDLLPDVYACDEPVPAGHVDDAELARLAGAQQDGQPFRGAAARHIHGCAQCTDVLQAQEDVRRLLETMTVVALPDAGREAMLERIAVRARSVLPGQVPAPPVVRAPGRVLSPVPVAMSLLLAVALGVGLGALLSRPAPAAHAAARDLPPVTAPSLTPLPGDTPLPPRPVPSTLVFTYPPSAVPTPSRPAATQPVPTPTSTPSPGFRLRPPGGTVVGSQLLVLGTGWTPGGAVTVTITDLRGTATLLSSGAMVGADGRFTLTLPPIPSTATVGEYRVTTTDGTHTRGVRLMIRAAT